MWVKSQLYCNWGFFNAWEERPPTFHKVPIKLHLSNPYVLSNVLQARHWTLSFKARTHQFQMNSHFSGIGKCLHLFVRLRNFENIKQIHPNLQISDTLAKKSFSFQWIGLREKPFVQESGIFFPPIWEHSTFHNVHIGRKDTAPASRWSRSRMLPRSSPPTALWQHHRWRCKPHRNCWCNMQSDQSLPGVNRC